MPKLKNIFLHLLIMSLFVGFLLAIRFKPITQSLEFDYDEGLNLIKAFLYGQGFSLYTQIWNDQPPIFTVILSQWLNLFGQSIFAARFLIMLFSALLIWCFYQIINSELGKIPAFVATLILFTSGQFIRLSISVMIGIPSLSLAMLSIYLLTLYKQHHRQYLLILSGALLALSLQTKLFTVFLIPLMLFSIADFKILALDSKKHLKNLSQSIIVWLGTLAIIYIVIGFWYQQFSNFNQIFKSHFHQPIEKELINFNNLEYLPYMIRQDYDYVFLAFIGILAIIFKKQQSGLLPLTWLASAILILLNHKPIWYHYYPLLAIPISWLVAYAVALVCDFFKGWHQNANSLKIKKLIFLVFTSAILILLIVTTPGNAKGKPSTNVEVIQLLLKHKKSTHWLFTDRPIYAFYARLPVPPKIAVMSYKRLNSGDLTSKDLLATLQNYCPEQMVLGRWISKIKSDSDFMAYINENYSKTYTDEKNTVEHYLLKEVHKCTPKQ